MPVGCRTFSPGPTAVVQHSVHSTSRCTVRAKDTAAGISHTRVPIPCTLSSISRSRTSHGRVKRSKWQSVCVGKQERDPPLAEDQLELERTAAAELRKAVSVLGLGFALNVVRVLLSSDGDLRGPLALLGGAVLFGGAFVRDWDWEVQLGDFRGLIEVHLGAVYLQTGYPEETGAICGDDVQVRDTSDGRGRGAFATRDLPEGTRLGDYEGELLSDAEYWGRYPEGLPDYCIRLDPRFTMDGAARAQSCAFTPAHINHSAKRWNVARKCIRRRRKITFYTARPIVAGEELLLDYGRGYWRGREDKEQD